MSTPTEERWAYAGVRTKPGARCTTRSDSLVDSWFSDRGMVIDQGLWLVKRAAHARYVIGAIYTVQITRDGDRIIRHGDPSYTDEVVDDHKRLEWVAQDAHARLDRQVRLNAMNENKADALDQALQPLRELIHSRRTFAEREALLVTVLRRLMAG